jgi:hypothetical protein
MNGGNVLHRLNTLTQKIETLSSTDTGISSFDIANNTIVYSKLKYQIHLNYILLKPISKK